jgi:serine/threonine protein kinase
MDVDGPHAPLTACCKVRERLTSHASRMLKYEVPATVGPYEVIRPIAGGGMAGVYLARQHKLGRYVALKLLNVLPGDDPEVAARFLHEARVAGSLSHPNIIATHDYFVHDGIACIAMEYMPHGSLRPHAHSLSLPQIAGVLDGVLGALRHAHENGVVHRDVKPENVLLADRAVKLADFGIAKALSHLTTLGFQTAPGANFGTPAYMAPELAEHGTASPRSDLYAVGVMAYEMLTRRLPFGDAEHPTPASILLGHIRGEVTPPTRVVPTLDPRLGAWIERMMARDPAARPDGADEAWRELEDLVVELEKPLWRRRSALLDAGQPASPVTPAPTAEPIEPRRRSGGLLAAGAVALVALAACLSYLALAKAPEPLLDTTPVEAKIARLVEFQTAVERVDCPDDVPLRAGVQFACDVRVRGSAQRLLAIVTHRADGHNDVRLRLR